MEERIGDKVSFARCADIDASCRTVLLAGGQAGHVLGDMRERLPEKLKKELSAKWRQVLDPGALSLPKYDTLCK